MYVYLCVVCRSYISVFGWCVSTCVGMDVCGYYGIVHKKLCNMFASLHVHFMRAISRVFRKLVATLK